MSDESESDVQVLEEKICHYGGDNSQPSRKRKKHSSKKKKKKKSKRYKQNIDGSITLVDLVSDSENEIEPEEKIAFREKLTDYKKCDLNKESLIKGTCSSSNLINYETESTSTGENVFKNNINENKEEVVINKTSELANKKLNVDNEELQKYIGNISEIDFSDMEMDTEVSQEPLIPVECQKAVDKSIVKEKNNSTNNLHVPNVFWKKVFDVEDDCSSQTSQKVNSLTKNVEDIKENSAIMTDLQDKSLMENVNQENKNTLTKSMPQTKSPLIKESSKQSSVKSNLPMTIDANGNKVFRFFWWDAYEAYKPPGVVYLFGKVHIEKTNNFKSCCIAVRNIPRRIYVLPRKFIQMPGLEESELNSLENVYNDVNEYLQKINVDTFKCKAITKMYCFDKKDVPQSATYLEVRYSALYPAIDPNYSSPVVQAVFETSMSPLELFLIERNIKGPCWLDLKISQNKPNKYSSDSPLFSWCEIETNCFKMEDISVTRYQNKSALIPSIVLAALYVQVSLDLQSHKKEIINIVILLNHKFQMNKSSVKPSFDQSYCLVTHPQMTVWPNNASEILSKTKQSKVICCKDELELLEKLLEILKQSNPDVLVSYDSKFQLEVLVHQIITLKVKDWSRIGKLKCFQPPRFKDRIYLDQLFCGRPFCDIQTSIKELNLKITNNDLFSLCSDILHKKINKCKTINPEDCPNYYESAEKLESLIRSTMIKAFYVLEIALELNVLPLAVQQTCIAGNTLSRTLAAGVSERNEYLLLHAFHANNYVTPEKRKGKEDPNKKATYSGGMILEPVKGFYDSFVLSMDFNSLYPSIIMEFNICFTTITGAGYEDFIKFYSPDVKLPPGILPIEMKKLIDGRDQVKKLMQSELREDLKFQYNIRQLALKLIANSVYGCLGAPYSRFYAKGLAALIAMKGREIFQKTVNIVRSLGYKVIYGDTDSIMIQTKILTYDNAIALGKCIKQNINKSYKKIKLDIDAVYKCLLLLMKKQYAAISITKSSDDKLKYTKEIKGLEMIKRNYCSLACDTGNQVLDQLLCDQPNEQRANNILQILRTASKNLQEGNSPLSSLEIVKQLSKDPSKYQSSQVSSHATVAQRLNKNNGRKWQQGDIISYVICKDGTDRNAGERAYHVTEITANTSLEIDADYYLSNQIYPVVSKICVPIEGISGQLIAEALGVKRSILSSNQQNSEPLSVKKNCFEECIPFEFYCQNRNCKSINQVKTVVVESSTGCQPSLAACSNITCDIPPVKYAHYIHNKLQLDIRKFITQYYRSELKCDNQLCLKVYESVALDSSSKFLNCHSCLDGRLHRIYKESDLFNQLCFFLHIFTLKESHFENLIQKPSTELLDFYNKIREFIMDEIDNSAYNVVDLTKIFNPNRESTDNNQKNNIDDLAKRINFMDVRYELDEEYYY